jgi:hypothetical protein
VLNLLRAEPLTIQEGKHKRGTSMAGKQNHERRAEKPSGCRNSRVSGYLKNSTQELSARFGMNESEREIVKAKR